MTFAQKLREALTKAKAAAPAGTWNAEAWDACVNATAHAEGISRKKKPKGAGRARNPLFDALALATGTRDLTMISRNGAKAIGVALADIMEVAPNLTVEEINRVVSAYRARHPTWPCTAPAVAKHWGEFSGKMTRSGLNDPYQEPKGWREWMKRKYPNTPFVDDIPTKSWLDVPIEIRLKCLKELKPPAP